MAAAKFIPDVFEEYLDKVDTSKVFKNGTLAKNEVYSSVFVNIAGVAHLEITVENLYYSRKGLTVYLNSSAYVAVEVDHFEETVTVLPQIGLVWAGLEPGNILVSSSIDGVSLVGLFENEPLSSVGDEFLLNGILYRVENVDLEAKTVTIRAFPVGVFSVEPLKYVHGTIYMTATQIARKRDNLKYPMLYLHEVIRETLNNWESPWTSSANCRLFFLDSSNFQDWDTDDHYLFVLTGLRKYVEYFKECMQFYGKLQIRDTVEVTSHANFGQYQEDKGHTKLIFNEKTSGIEMGGLFDFKLNSCNC